MLHRPERVQKLIREELSKLMLRELEFDGALVTITNVATDKKLNVARVMMSVLPSSAAERALATASNSEGNLQYLLVRKINIKPMPKIQFELDRGLENAAEVERLLLKK